LAIDPKLADSVMVWTRAQRDPPMCIPVVAVVVGVVVGTRLVVDDRLGDAVVTPVVEDNDID